MRVMPSPATAAVMAASLVELISAGRSSHTSGSPPSAKGQRVVGVRPVAEMMVWPGSSFGCCGVPRRSRYSGDAISNRRMVPTRAACSDESGRSPRRTATSTASSSMFTTRSTNRQRACVSA